MFGRRFNPIISILIVLAIFGFGFTMFNNPGSLFMNLLISAGVIALVSGLFYFFLLRPKGSTTKNYRKAVKQSKKKYGTSAKMKQSLKTTSKVASNRPKRKRKADHLRVIEGNKGKKKNRAFF